MYFYQYQLWMNIFTRKKKRTIQQMFFFSLLKSNYLFHFEYSLSMTDAKLLFLFIIITQSISQDIRSLLLSEMIDIEYQCNSVLSRFRFSGGRLKCLEGLLGKTFSAIQLFMKSTVYFRVVQSKFRVGAAHPVHPIDKTLHCIEIVIEQRLIKKQLKWCISIVSDFSCPKKKISFFSC